MLAKFLYAIHFLLLSLLFIPGLCLKALGQVKFVSPMEGIAGKDYFLVNYVDQDTASGKIKDGHCGNKTYDGHQGTDMVIKDFTLIDKGVAVYAAADGRVFETKDSLYDRNKESVISLGFGNYIAINHKDSLFTYYAHLKKYSLLVKVGDSVKAGQKIAEVGCSGNCTDPHLHFEVWTWTKNIDPFSGSCNAGKSLWLNEPAYDTMLKVIDQGFVFYHPGLDTLRERYRVKDSLNQVPKDSTINFWVQLQGIRAGDSSQIEWYTPGGIQWFRYSYTHTYDAWYYYWWSYIDIFLNMQQGWWQVKYYVNNQQVTTDSFYQGLAFTGMDQLRMPEPIACWQNGNILYTRLPASNANAAISCTLTDMQGRQITLSPNFAHQDGKLSFKLPTSMANGTYISHIQVGERSYFGKLILQE